jgi:hypothetical protein
MGNHRDYTNRKVWKDDCRERNRNRITNFLLRNCKNLGNILCQILIVFVAKEGVEKNIEKYKSLILDAKELIESATRGDSRKID